MKNVCSSNKKILPLYIIITIILLITIFISFLCGRFSDVSFIDIYKAVEKYIFGIENDLNYNAEVVIIQLRLPRILGACMIGSALALSGTAYQALFRNPIASPDTLGVTNAASFAAVLGICLGLRATSIKIIAFVVGTFTVFTVFLLASVLNRGKNLTTNLLLIGMIMSSVFSALLAIIKYVADPDNQLPQITYWLLGSLSKITTSDVKLFFPCFLLGTLPLLFLRWRMNLLALSDAEMRAVGENVVYLRAIVIFCATMLTAASTSMTGGINWVGLIIPHIARLIAGTDFRRVIPLSCLLGAVFLLIMDDFARCISINELPISILTSLVGAPVFFIILFINRGNSEYDN